MTRDGITTTLFHTLADQLASEANSGGTLNGLRVTNAFDALLRRTQVAARNGASALNATDYTFDNASRLSTVSDGTQSGNYSYVANSPLISQIAFKQSSTTRMTTRKAYDNLNRLQTITHREGETPSNPLISSFAYSYNAANQRTRVHLADNSYWSFGYDTLDQLKSGKHYWSDGTPVAGQQFEYGFDDIGNRRTTKAGGDSVGAGLRSASYTLNNLNQITQRTVPGAADVIGAATATATNVNVNNVMAYRRGEYYRVELSINNASAAQWQSITNRAVQNGTTNLVTGNVFLPKTPEVISYDADGNLTNDGRWAYVWDGENRLTRLVAPSAIPTGARLALNFTNDWQGRRISKVVSNWTGSAWSKSYEHKYLYDGWNLIAVLDSANTLLHSFRWGTDLSGTLQGAGGVGGLILMTVHSGTYAGTYFYAHDGNGNVAALINAADGTIAARYEYGPFHELIRATGPLAFLNPFRASTKFQDDETGFLYYGYRYYDPSTGRWLGRDPIEERGGLNLYGFVSNNPISNVDPFGLWTTANHEYLIDHAFPNLSEAERNVLKKASKDADSLYPGQLKENSHWHAMSQPGEDVGKAAVKWSQYVEGLRQKAAKCEDRSKSLYDFGRALHGITDSTSPSHRGFQPWILSEAIEHHNKEKVMGIDDYNYTVKLMRNFYETTYKAKPW